ncbi:transcriptional corepressor SEUSS-like isoform X1 [Salvia splendens]|uniref:transcriptional corepressor SEUSS-like isoform X1 n=1 Tax=Salvia splendens TaxID=180675 RepID=UPI001C260CB0|nr:transcriptional corepressor SEUSS-like isoform X1 [Salvia splendens]
MSGDKRKMVPQGPPAPLGGGQPVPPSLLRANSGLLGSQGGGNGMPSQNAFPSLVSPRNQFNNMNPIGNAPNVSMLHQSFGNGGPRSGPGITQRGLLGDGAESDPLSGIGNGMGYNQPSSSYMSSPMALNPNPSGQAQGQQQFSNNSSGQMLTDQQQAQQLDAQNFQHNQQQLQQFSGPSSTQQQQQQQQYQGMHAGLGGGGHLKLEPQVTNEQTPQQLQTMRNLGPVKLEPQQLHNMRGLGPVKMAPQQSDSSLFMHQQQQQHHLLSRQSSQAGVAAQILHQQRLMQIQQHQLLKSMPQQRSQLQSQFQNQNLPIRSPVKPVYEPGTCARRLTHYMYQQQHRPEDNSIEFWRKFVAEYFVPNAKKKWCVSMYGSGRQTNGVFPQDIWHCEICNRRPGRGFEATAEVLPRLFKIKYESGTLEELLYVDMPREYQNSYGQIVLDYAKAIQESVFEQLRVVRDGQLRIVFSPDLKICSWEFCARRHEELIPRRLLIPQVSQLGAAAQKCQAATSNTSSSSSVSELQNNCNTFVASARQLAKALEVPLVNDLGYTKRYVRCLQISEVVNSMKDLIDYSCGTGTGPMESLTKFPQRTKAGFQGQPQRNEGQQQEQTMGQNASNPGQAAVMQLAAASNGMPSVSNTTNTGPTTSTSNIAVLLHQNSINSRHQNPVSNANSPYGGGNSAQMQSPGSSVTMRQSQSAPSPFQSPAPSSSNNPQPSPYGGGLSGAPANSPNVSMQQPSLSGDADAHDSKSSVQKIIHDMMMSSQLGGAGMMGTGSTSGDMKNVNGMLSANNSAAMNGINSLAGHGVAAGNHSMGGLGFGSLSNGHGQSTSANGVRSAVGNNTMPVNGRLGLPMTREQSLSQQEDLGSQLHNGMGTVNGFHDLQFDWKSSP